MNSTEKAMALNHLSDVERILEYVAECHGIEDEARQHIDQAKTIIEASPSVEHLAEAVMAIFNQCKKGIYTTTEIAMTALILSRALSDIAKLCQPHAPKKVEEELWTARHSHGRSSDSPSRA